MSIAKTVLGLTAATIISGCYLEPVSVYILHNKIMNQEEIALSFQEHQIDRNPIMYDCIKKRKKRVPSLSIQVKIACQKRGDGWLMSWWTSFSFEYVEHKRLLPETAPFSEQKPKETVKPQGIEI